jgi:hypothetical protein
VRKRDVEWIRDKRTFRFSDEREEKWKQQAKMYVQHVYPIIAEDVKDIVCILGGDDTASVALLVWAVMYEMIGEKLLDAADKMMILSKRARRAEFEERHNGRV